MSTTFRVYRGDSATLALTLTEPFATTPFNPTGWALLATFKADAGDADSAAVIQKSSVVGGFTVTDAAAGEVDLELVPGDYTLIEGGQRYVFDVQAQNESTGAVKTVFSGILRVQDDVSESTTLSIPTTVANPNPGYLTAAEIAVALAAAQAAQTAAEAANEAADADVAATAGYANAAANSAQNALTYANAALTRRNDASEFASAAGVSAGAASVSATAAAGSATAANLSALAAAASATTAQGAVATLVSIGTSILRGNGLGGFASTTIGSGLTYDAGTLSLSITPDIGVATGTRLRLSLTDDATDATGTTGSLGVLGGVSIAKGARIGTTLNVAGVATFANSLDALSSTSAGTVVSGGLAIAKAAVIGTTLTVGSTVSIGGLLRGANAADATDASGTTGGFGTIGGLSVARKSFFGGPITVTGTSETSSISGPLSLASTLAVTGTSTLTGLIRSANATAATDATGATGAIGTLGGISAAKASYFGDTVNLYGGVKGTVGSESITLQADRDFSGANNWIAETGWTISGGAATKVVTGSRVRIRLLTDYISGYVSGMTYRLSFTITTTTPFSESASISYLPYVATGGTTTYIWLGESGTFTWTGIVTLSGTAGVNFWAGASWAGSVTGFSLKPITAATAGASIAGTTLTSSSVRSIAIGGGTGQWDQTGSNVVVGYAAGSSVSTGYYNTVIGDLSGKSLSTGIGNTILGAASAGSLVSGNYNTAIGYGSLGVNNGGSENSALGAYAGPAPSGGTLGAKSTFVGAYSGYSSKGSSHVFLGYSAGRYEIGSNTFYVDNQDRTNNTNERARALLYGTFNADASLQTLRTNAAFSTLGTLTVDSVSEYADNAAAVTAGLPNGRFYRTGDVLKVVHA